MDTKTQSAGENWFHFSFIHGPISHAELTLQTNKISEQKDIGAYSFFLGQVRRDKIADRFVEAIEYTANDEMARQQFNVIAKEVRQKYSIQKLLILHSLGDVKCGELCLMVIVACGHRKESIKACELIVERLKKEVPVWGREIFEDQTHQWKVNKF